MARNDTFSQWNTDVIGIGTVEVGGLADPDGNAVTVTIVRASNNATVVTAGVAIREGVGLYSYTIGPDLVTANKDTYTATWSYNTLTPASRYAARRSLMYPSGPTRLVSSSSSSGTAASASRFFPER